MRKIGGAISAIVLGLAIGSTGVAAAEPRATGECSSGFEAMTVREVLRTIAAAGSEQAIIDEDKAGMAGSASRSFPMKGDRRSSIPRSSLWTTTSDVIAHFR